MSKRIVIIGAGLTTALIAYLLFCGHSLAPHHQTHLPPPEIQPLAEQNDLIGEWNRVEFPEAVFPGNWRKFLATGQFQARYGDVIHWGTYRFTEGGDLETIEGHNGEVNRWTVGRANGKLVLIHPLNGWVEQYVRAGSGMLEP
jgi:hypothetical protein